jgi:hypothetical protein
MKRTYFTWEEDEAYNQGRKDIDQNRRDWERERTADEGPDKAYWEGRKDREREKENERLNGEYLEREYEDQ